MIEIQLALLLILIICFVSLIVMEIRREIIYQRVRKANAAYAYSLARLDEERCRQLFETEGNES